MASTTAPLEVGVRLPASSDRVDQVPAIPHMDLRPIRGSATPQRVTRCSCIACATEISLDQDRLMGDVAKLTRGGGSDGGSCTHSDDAEGFDVVVWEADGLVDGRLGYGAPIAMRLAAAGLAARVVPLTERVPTDGELAAPVHIVSGGSTSVDADAAWLVAARDRLAVVLDRALEGA